ncbi:MAG: short-chain dehydrogenase [Gammaproteobacteria bacterium]|nr:short-chain dehydrogenase [Gammaproteobacteria bacterium]|tara:strand:- start:551 stop:1333 length:783 start_codon:yes stop_codon:yes gene_type:complete
MTDLSLKNKCILITGGSQGVGFAIAEACCALKARHLILIGRDKAKGQIAINKLSTDNTKVSFLSADLSNEKSTKLIFDFVNQEVDGLDGLVNAAGITTRGSFIDGKIEDWDQLFAVNTRSPFFLMQAFILQALEKNKPGSIVNISSMHTYCGLPELAMYAGSKAAISTLTKNAANAHIQDHIRVNAIAMGWAATPAEKDMQANKLGKGENWVKEIASQLPLGRLLDVSEVANLAVYLLGDMSGMQTGTIIDLEQKILGAM